MKVIFVCSPFQEKHENIERARRYSGCSLMSYIPISPHICFSQFMDDNNLNDGRKASEMNKKLLESSDKINNIL